VRLVEFFLLQSWSASAHGWKSDLHRVQAPSKIDVSLKLPDIRKLEPGTEMRYNPYISNCRISLGCFPFAACAVLSSCTEYRITGGLDGGNEYQSLPGPGVSKSN
jgi:hypothetical protein